MEDTAACRLRIVGSTPLFFSLFVINGLAIPIDVLHSCFSLVVRVNEAGKGMREVIPGSRMELDDRSKAVREPERSE